MRWTYWLNYTQYVSNTIGTFRKYQLKRFAILLTPLPVEFLLTPAPGGDGDAVVVLCDPGFGVDPVDEVVDEFVLGEPVVVLEALR